VRNAGAAPIVIEPPDADEIIVGPSRWLTFGGYVDWISAALFGAHGVLSHFPVMVIGMLGIGAVMHRHWPLFVKALAAASAIAAIAIVLLSATVRADWREAMFATRWFVLFLPLLLFWSGAWLRRSHARTTWACAGVLLAFSVFVSIIGMTEPYPRDGYRSYTARAAFDRLLHGAPASSALARNPP
jgi:hypothetical protein